MTSKCPKCDGKGYISVYAHVEGGICFHCAGKGHITARRAATAKSPSQRKAKPYIVNEAKLLAKIDRKIASGEDVNYWQTVRRTVERGDRLTGFELQALSIT